MTFRLSRHLRLNGSKGWLALVGLLWAQSDLDAAYQALEKRLTVSAQKHLKAAMSHPDSGVRAEAALLQGFIAKQGGRRQEALNYWYQASQLGKGTPLASEAAFHRAHTLLEQRKDWPSALYLFRTLLESPETPPDLRALIEKRLIRFGYYEADPGFLWGYLSEGHTILSRYLSEALLYHLQKSCEWGPWRLLLNTYKSACGAYPTAENIDSLLSALPPETLRLAVILPFMAGQSTNSPFFMFWQGLRCALQTAKSPYQEWRLYVYDSERNPTQLRRILEALDTLRPHLVLGDVSYSLNQFIADWASTHQVWHAIPINPAYPERPYSFPLGVPARCLGENLASYLSAQSGLTQGVILYEAEDPVSQAVVEGFVGKLYAPKIAIPTQISSLVQRWATLKDSLSSYDWYFVALNNEEAVGFLLAKLGRSEGPLPYVLGLESWLDFTRLELKDYRRLILWIPQTSLPDSTQWRTALSRLRAELGTIPRTYHIRGYEAGQFLVQLSTSYLPEAPPQMSLWEGLFNKYALPVQCQLYRWKLWEYRQGEVIGLYEYGSK